MSRLQTVAKLSAFTILMVWMSIPAWATSINTYPGWNGSSEICCMANPNTATYGEVITAPSTSTLTDFSFWLQAQAGWEFQAFVAPWDSVNHDLAGPMSYLSSVETSVNPSLVQYSLTGVNVPVLAGDLYVLGVTIDNVYSHDAGRGAALMGGTLFSGSTPTDYFVWSNDSGNGALLHASWNNTGCAVQGCGQAAFQADFGAVPTPEPATLTLTAFGLAGAVARYRRRRQ